MLPHSLVLALAASAVAVPFSPYVLHEKRVVKLDGRTTRVSGDSIVPVKIGLTQSNLDNIQTHLMDVSDPLSSNYGKHWTVDEVHAMYAPSDETVKAVKEWLVSSGIDANSIVTSYNQGWLAVDMPAHQAESLFKTEYYEHENAQDGTVRLGCDSYHLPGHLSNHIDLIKPGVTLSAPLTKKTVKRSNGRNHKLNGRLGGRMTGILGYNSTTPRNSTCGTAITPACIKAMYSIPNANVSASVDPANKLGILEIGDEYLQEDLNLYFKNLAPYVPQGTHPTPVKIDGLSPVAKQPGQNVQGEADIDLQMAYSLIYPQAITIYEQPQLTLSSKKLQEDLSYISLFLDAIDGSFCTSFDKKNQAQCGMYNLTRVVSISYGLPEFDATVGGSFGAQQRSCNEIAKLGLQGTTVVVSSGDYGVGASPQQENSNGCAAASSSGIVPLARNGSLFNVNFPQSCPYVLSVGATQLNRTQNAGDPESVMFQPKVGLSTPNGATFSSSGGFSNVFAMPSYQQNAVNTYFSQHDPGYPSYNAVNGTGIGANGGVFNRAGRGFPDVAANGALFSTFIDGKSTQEYGTSLAAPLWASLITLINEERCAAGKSPVGFVNPTLYSNPSAFHDIVNGRNAGCNTKGFEAVPGWEPATGLGTPDYPSLLQVFMNLP